MVVKEAAGFCSDTLSKIRTLSLAGSLCDVTLSVGHDQIQAHRCVLAARSEYFHTLFLGQFKEASMQNIDLSEVTNDIKDLENVVNFLYTGKVEITDTNLEVLVKLSTFLLIGALRLICMQYMYANSNLGAWLDYYLLAVEHSLDEIEDVGFRIVMSRFYDFFIHEDNWDLTPDDVQLLLSNDMFQHCTIGSVLQFVYKWLTDEITDQHFSVASEIFDTMENQAVDNLSDQQKYECKQTLNQMEEKLHNENNANVKIFLEKSEKILAQISPKLETESNCQEKVGESCARTASLSSGPEEVIVTLSPKQCVVDKFSEVRKDHYCNFDKNTFKEPTFTLCCYTPNTKTWYHIQDFKNEAAIADLPKHCGERYAIKAFLFNDKLALIWCRKRVEVYLYSLRDQSWKLFYIPELYKKNWCERERVFDFCLVNGNSCMYLIAKMVLEEGEYEDYDLAAEYFVGLKLDEDGKTKRIFERWMDRDCACENSDLQAAVSSVSNELMFTCGPKVYYAGNRTDDYEGGNSYVFIVDLNNEQPKAVNLLKEVKQEPKKGLTGVKIVQTKSHFYIINDGTVESRTGDVRSIYKYKFHSQHLTKLKQGANQQDGETTIAGETRPPDGAMPKELYETNPPNETNTEAETDMLNGTEPGDETSIQDKARYGFTINQLEGKEEGMFPCCEQLTVSHSNTLWSFEGDRNFVSGLHEVGMEIDGSFSYEEHTPPPFSCVSLMAVGELPADLVAQWTPVKKFHHSSLKKCLD